MADGNNTDPLVKVELGGRSVKYVSLGGNSHNYFGSVYNGSLRLCGIGNPPRTARYVYTLIDRLRQDGHDGMLTLKLKVSVAKQFKGRKRNGE
jgi:hypothetical protein